MNTRWYSKFLAGLVTGLILLSLLVNSAMAAAGIRTRVSVASDITQGNSSSSNPSFTADGLYMAVPSGASNLGSGDVTGAQMPQTSVPSLLQDTAEQNPCTAISNLGKHLPIGANSLYPIIDAMSIASTPRTMDFYHSGVDSSVHIVDQLNFPNTGNQRYYFPAMTANLIITADGVRLNYTMGSDFANGTFLFADVNVPTGTTLLKLDYDQLDSAIAFEGLWYLAYGWNWGPMTMIVHLPSDASIVRYEGASFATLLDSHTLKFVIPDGTAFYDTVVYSTTSVPNLYDTITSPHFQVFLPSVYRPYSDRIVSLLENAYILFSQYSGQDVNQLANQTHYDYYFPPGGWYWWGSTITLWGGLTVLGGPSAVSSRFIPDINFTVSYGYNYLVAIMYHELGNGWWLLMSNGGLPWWVNGEGHSGFLRSQAELDMNYCADAQREHQNHYQDYLQCMQAPPSGNHCNEEIILISLLQKYGWQPFRNIYASVWNGSLNLNGLSDDEKDSQMVLFFSQQVNQNLVSFFRSQRIYASPQVESALSSLPVGNVPIISALSCRTPPIVPTVVSSVAADTNPTNAASVNFTVTFSRYMIGVDVSDFTLVTTGVTGASVSTVSGSGTTYTVTVNSGSGNGTIRLDVIDNDSIIDGIIPLGGIGAGNGDYTSGETYMVVKTQTFADVLYTHWAYFWIDRLYAAGITSGCGTSPLIYCPENNVTRAQMAIFLERGMNGSAYTPPPGSGMVFADVPISYWAVDWIERLYADGITTGCSTSPLSYCPEDSVTRSQMAVFLLRAKDGAAYIPPSATGVFADVPTTYWAASWIEQLYAEGITSGCGTSPLSYCPEDPVTRAQMAVFLVKTFNLP